VIPSGRLWLLLLVLTGLLLAVRDAPADEPIARRLAALKVLVNPKGAQQVVPNPPRAGGDACAVRDDSPSSLSSPGSPAPRAPSISESSCAFRASAPVRSWAMARSVVSRGVPCGSDSVA